MHPLFTSSNLALGAVAALVIGLSKTAIPGGGLLASPLIASVVTGRLIAGTTLPLLLVADLFAVTWFGRNARFDVLRPLIAPTVVGFGAGAVLFIATGSGGRALDVILASTILILVAIQGWRLIRKSPPATDSAPLQIGAGLVGGFATFVSNAAGPVVNTYFTALRLSKTDLIGTGAVFYFSVNVAKVPIYLGIGRWSHGGPFFTAETLRFNAVLAPVVVGGVLIGRAALSRIPQAAFTTLVLAFAAVAALRILLTG